MFQVHGASPSMHTSSDRVNHGLRRTVACGIGFCWRGWDFRVTCNTATSTSAPESDPNEVVAVGFQCRVTTSLIVEG
ncbi:uncharacterized protein [Lolium perenne]|uniref:uncharacterized protein isoform X3 n=1 Tax=Lolium perenne TaxID=4522 RepID=UPI003A98F31F